MDEGEGLAKYADQLKNLTTCGQINYEIKGVMSSTCNNYINILITTNHEKPVLVETSDRRFVLFKASDIHLKNVEYYATLGTHLKSKEVARAFYPTTQNAINLNLCMGVHMSQLPTIQLLKY